MLLQCRACGRLNRGSTRTLEPVIRIVGQPRAEVAAGHMKQPMLR